MLLRFVGDGQAGEFVGNLGRKLAGVVVFVFAGVGDSVAKLLGAPFLRGVHQVVGFVLRFAVAAQPEDGLECRGCLLAIVRLQGLFQRSELFRQVGLACFGKGDRFVGESLLEVGGELDWKSVV